MAGILVSPKAKDPSEIPIIPITDFLFENLKTKLPRIADKSWVVSWNSHHSQLKYKY